jgi:hypothetical protein
MQDSVGYAPVPPPASGVRRTLSPSFNGYEKEGLPAPKIYERLTQLINEYKK